MRDLVVVGAGSAGMSAAIASRRMGLSVIIVDENATLGGQVYRSVGASPVRNPAILGRDYWAGKALVDAAISADIEHLSSAAVWMIEREDDASFSVGVSQAGQSRMMNARAVLIATGALERPFPIQGWTLPGVMTAGAGQSLLKTSGLVPDGPLVLAGTGPLLYLLAAQYSRAGVSIDALLDTTPRSNWRVAMKHLPAFLFSPYCHKGLRLLMEVERATQLVRGVTALRALGDTALQEVAFVQRGRERRIAAQTLMLHQGVVPQVNLSMAAGCEHRWDDARLAFEPVLSDLGATSVPGIFIAGDSAGIGGAVAAEISGGLAALGVALHLRRIAEVDGRAVAHRRELAEALRGRRFLDALYRPAPSFRLPSDDVIICRCEEITAGAVRQVALAGAPGPNQAKTFLRAGMGLCQGRLCGVTVTEIMSEATRRVPSDIGHYRLRNPVKPLTLGELASACTKRSKALRLD